MSDISGKFIGRYQILEKLGEGGMATVYKAYDTRLERDVALKIIKREVFPLQDLDNVLKRFEREAKALAKLSHLNIIKVIDYGEYNDSPYLVMEFISGGTLAQRIGNPIRWKEALRILIPIAKALQYAHEEGMIHRDVKPTNILITRSGDPMLTDFGIAKILKGDEIKNLTGTGVGVGTPEYMAPEQWVGGAEVRSDQYSLGVILYEMVTGEKPYTADTPAAVLIKQINEPLPKPSEFVKNLPEEVEMFLIKALAKRPEDRFESMAEFVREMNKLVLSKEATEFRDISMDGIGVPKIQQEINQKEGKKEESLETPELPLSSGERTETEQNYIEAIKPRDPNIKKGLLLVFGLGGLILVGFFAVIILIWGKDLSELFFPNGISAPTLSSPPIVSRGGDEVVTVRIGWAGSPDTLNPGMAVLSEAYTIFELVYDSIYDLNLDGTFSLSLAESAAVSDDHLVWTFKIRDDITFHDGAPLTAEDVVFSILLYQNTEDYPWMGDYCAYFYSVVATDDNEVVITLTDPIPNIESQLIFLYILPKHIWEAEDPAEFDNLEMIGSGPFKMVEYSQNEFVQLAANRDHFTTPPKVDEVVFQTFENNDALVQALKTGQVDMITEMPAIAIEALRAEENIEVVVGAPFAPVVTDIIFNQVLPEDCPRNYGICSGHPALLDRDVRLALTHATDKAKIIEVIFLGEATPGLTLIPEGLGIWYNDTIEDYNYDVALANQILDDAGYLDTDGDGVRDMPDRSRPLTFRLNWPSDSIDGPRLAGLISEMWEEVGVDLELQALDPDTLTAVCCPAFDFDIILWGWGSDPDPNLLLSVMTTWEIPTGSSETGYSNPVFDDLYDQQATESDLNKRLFLVWEMQQIVFDDVVYIIPYYDPAFQAYRKDRFKGWIIDMPKLELSDPTSLVIIEPIK